MKKRLLLLVLSLMINYCLIGQTFKVIENNDTINRVDVAGLKQGP